jgi:hypothetical protein
LSRKGVARIGVACNRDTDCDVALGVSTAKAVRTSATRKIVTLGRGFGRIKANRRGFVTVRLSKKSRRIVKRARRLRVRIRATSKNLSGFAQSYSATVSLLAPKK